MEQKRYTQKPEDLFYEFNSGETGLDSSQVLENRQKYGENKLAEKKKKYAFQIFLEQIKDFLVIILNIAAIISAIT